MNPSPPTPPQTPQGIPQRGIPAVFLDRDGTLNRPVVRNGLPYPPASPEEFSLYDDVPAGCARLREAGYALVVATNQPDVGRGTQSREVVEAMHARLCKLVPEIALIQVCWHGGRAHGQPCDCRKPAPGLLLTAAARLGLDLASSWMVGDRWRDIDCGRAAGCRTILLDRAYAEPLGSPPDHTVASFSEAVAIILART